MQFLGSITGSSGTYYNNQTGASGVGTFAIPPNTRALYLVPSASGLLFELSIATGVTSFSSFQRGAQLAGPGTINGPFRIRGENVSLGISHNQTGFISCRVFFTPSAS